MIRSPLPGLAALLLFLLGCGGSSGSTAIPVDPEPRTVAVGDQLAIAARPEEQLGDLAWEVEEPYGGGLRNSQGTATVYFAPPAAGTYHLVLRATRADGRPLRQEVAIQVLPIPTVEPGTVQVPPGGTAAFVASMKGLPRNTVQWKVQEPDGGQVSDDGQYTAPGRSGTFHVTATSTFDPAVAATATVTVE